MQDFALAREQIVVDAQARHSAQMKCDDGVGYHFGDFGLFAAALFDSVQRFSAHFCCVCFVGAEELRGLGVNVPAVVIEMRLHGHHFDADRRTLFHEEQADDHVGDLHAGVIDVILNLYAMAGVAQDADQGVAEHGVAYVADVRGLVRVDAGVLDDNFPARRGRRGRGIFCAAYVFPKRWAIKKGIQVARAGDFQAFYTLDFSKTVGNFLRENARSFFQAFRQFKAHGGSGFAHFDLRWPLEGHSKVNVVGELNVAGQGIPQTIFNGLVHASSFCQHSLTLYESWRSLQSHEGREFIKREFAAYTTLLRCGSSNSETPASMSFSSSASPP